MGPDHDEFGEQEDEEEGGGGVRASLARLDRLAIGPQVANLPHDQVEAFEQGERDDGSGFAAAPDPVVDEDRGRGRMAIDGSAVATKAEGNDGEIAIVRFAGEVALVAVFDVFVEKGARGLEIAGVGIDDGEVRGGQEFAENQGGSGVEAAAHDGDAADVAGLREERLKGSTVAAQDEALEAGGVQYQTFEDFEGTQI